MQIGFPEGKAIGLAMNVIEQHFAGWPTHEVLALLTKVLQYPENFLDDAIMAPIALSLMEKSTPQEDTTIA